MNMIDAARETLSLALAAGLDDVSSDVPESDYPHLKTMLSRMESGGFSEAKLGRWLGWMQASVVINSGGAITLEDMKQVNKRHSGD